MRIMTDQSYHVPVVPPDLRREETVQQLCDALAYLDKTANDIFSRISSRVAENQTRLKGVNDRISLAQAKIDKLKGSNKATKVFSSAKYPSPNEEESYQSVYTLQDKLQAVKRTGYHLQAKHQPLDDGVLKEKLQFYNVHLDIKKGKESEGQGEGLGRLPRHIPSISSLLLFNTSENPYKKYVMIDPRGVVTKTRSGPEQDEEGLAEAPSSITHREQLERQTKDDMAYRPKLGHLVDMELPTNLPGLGGIADDVLYSGDLGQSIAPSSLPDDLPAVADLPAVETDDVIPSGPAAPGGGSGAPPPPPPAGAPPPPPPPPAGPPPPPPPGPAAPPPPPPPAAPAPPPPPPAGATAEAPEGVPEEVVAPSDGRSDLLAAIRKGKKLRSVTEEKKKRKKEKEETVAKTSGGGDLMSDLMSKLSMRRKGIAGGKGGGGGGGGGKSEESGGAGSAMDKISAMIPPPPKPGGGGEDHGDDWE